MNAGAPGPPPDDAIQTARRKKLRRLLGSILGLILLAAAAWVVASHSSQMREAWTSAKSAHPALLAAALLLPFLNWLLISASFWVMMRRRGRIALGEMTALIGAAWLLNYLPLRAGMVGRVAYHKTVNNIAIADSLRVMVIGVLCAGVTVLVTLGIAAALAPLDASLYAWLAALAAPLVVLAIATLILRARARDPWLLHVLTLRYLDMLVWTARYAAVFAIVGSPIGLAGSVAIAAACQLALVVPFVGNGLGLREWAVGLTAAALPASLIAGGAPLDTATGLAADLANRAAELLIAVPVGLASIALLARTRQTS